MRGGPEEGDPSVQNGTFVNGFYEEWPIVYAEEGYGFTRTGQTIVNVTDSKIIRVFVDDEPFGLTSATVLHYERRLNMKSGTLDREVLWETPSGKRVRLKSRRLISFRQRHVAAISYEVTLLNAEASVVISSEMLCPQPGLQKAGDDPRQSKIFFEEVLLHRTSHARDRRIILAHGTKRTQMILACGIDHHLDSDCPYYYKTNYTENFGQVAFSIAAQPQSPIHLTKYMVYNSARNATHESICGRAEWTLDRVAGQRFNALLAEQEQYLDSFWQRSDVQVNNIEAERSKLTTVEMQNAIRVNLFHIQQASARAESSGVPAKGLTGQAYEGQYFWDTEIYLLPFLIYTSP
jgi:alpha,alpha-trehalose phosphorylase